ATIAGVDFTRTVRHGFTKEQFYSTASYKHRALPGISLHEDDVAGWDLSGQDLAGAVFESTRLTGANLSGANLTGVNFASAKLDRTNLDLADLRRARGFVVAAVSGASLRGATLLDGSV